MTEQERRIRELETVLRRKQQFLIDTLHEIRTPLDGIQGLAELVLRARDGGDGAEKYLGLILESSGQLRRLVNDLLQLERLESGEILYEIAHLEIGDLLDEVAPLCEALLSDKPAVRLEVAHSGQLPAVHGDVRKIRQVLMNFLGNAIQFTERGHIRIRLRELPTHVQVEIEDTGIGIAPDEQEAVWEQIQAAETGISPEFEGAGLSLSINKKIVTAHRGSIGLTSELSKGSTFWFTLPTCESGILPAMRRVGPDGEPTDEEVVYRPQVRGPRPPEDPPPTVEPDALLAPERRPVKREKKYREVATGDGETILVVDDSPVSIEILHDLLTAHGYRVVHAPDASTALATVDTEAPDLIVTELWLPDMSGFDLVKSLREGERTQLTPIILLTARRDREDIAYGLNLGADEYVQKPYDRGELLARIGVLLRLRRAQEELLTLNLRLEAEVRKRTAELAAANERLYLSEKLSSLGQLTAGIAHELNNPLAYVLSNVEMILERLTARRALEMVKRTRPLIRSAMGEGTRITLEETFLSALVDCGRFDRDVKDYREEAAKLAPGDRAERFLTFLSYVESASATRGGTAQDLDETTIRLLTASEEGIERVRDIVRDLSAFSHPGSESPAAVDVNDSVRRVLTILTPLLRERELRVRKSLRLKGQALAVAARLDQVLLNLVQNAAQAAPREGTIRIRTRADGRWARIEVEDRGEGIPSAARSRVFDPFFTTKPVGEGTGLGLAICYRIVERMNGDISFRTTEGRGTTFTVRLPLAEGHE